MSSEKHSLEQNEVSVAAAQCTETNLLVEKWLHHDLDQLISRARNDPLVKKFVASALPSLIQSHQGFIGEVGNIEVCLSISLDSETGKKTLSVVTMDGDYKVQSNVPELKPRLTTSVDSEVSKLFEVFVTDFPKAVVMTNEGKPLILFQGKGKSRHFLGYLSFDEFRSAYNKKYKTLTVGVPP